MKIFLRALLAVLVIVLIGGAIYLRTPAGPRFDAEAVRIKAERYDARIIRDAYGVPHIYGKTDVDASFGFGYAHAEDDWETIQDVIIAARGMTSQYQGKDSAPQDYLYDLFKVGETVQTQMDAQMPAHIQAICEAYADAINLFGADNPDRILPGVLPVSKEDVAAGFTWATPFFYRLDEYLQDLFTAEDRPDVSPYSQTASILNLHGPADTRGSNAFAVAPARSNDGHTRLIANSHQPMKGPYAWYETHMVSEEGLNLVGGTFPGVPIITQGANPNLAWTHTVNRPDLIDIYALEVNREKNPTQYKLDGGWQDFERSKSKFRVKLFGPFSLPVRRDVLWSDHGPVLPAPTGHYALKFAGLQEMGALEQWHAMGKATTMEQWRAALAQNGVLSFNIVYADKRGNIGHVYNARMPKRVEGPDWTQVLPGDQSTLIWDEYLPPTDLPQIWNPGCGWVFSANATPFAVTDPSCDLAKSDFSKTFGIEDRITNRSRRALAQLIPDPAISREELLRYRADTRYDPESDLMQMVVEAMSMQGDEPLLVEAKEVLRNWDGDTSQDSRGAALAVLTGVRSRGYEFLEETSDLKANLLKTAEDLITHHGRIDPEWGAVNRIQRGDLDLPLDGAPDVLRAIYANEADVTARGEMNAFAGDTHIMVADWDEDGQLRLDTIHNYGAATLDETSPYYSDQVEMFVRGEYKSFPMRLEDVLAQATQDYRPGQKVQVK